MTNTLGIASFRPVPDPRPDDSRWPDMVWPIPVGTRLLGRNLDLIPLDANQHAEPLFAAFDDPRVWMHFQCRGL